MRSGCFVKCHQGHAGLIGDQAREQWELRKLSRFEFLFPFVEQL